MAKKREKKQKQLATLDSLSLSAVKREHVQMTQKRITKSKAGCPRATLTFSPLSICSQNCSGQNWEWS